MMRRPISIATSVIDYPEVRNSDGWVESPSEHVLITTILYDDGTVWRQWGSDEEWEQIEIASTSATNAA